MRVVGDLPGMALGIDEDRRIAAPERLAGLARDLRAGRAGLLDHLVDLGGRAGVVGERDPAPAAAVGDSAVVGEPLTVPERDDHAAGLEERDVVAGGGSGRPAEGLVERPRPVEVADAERDEAEALVHSDLLALAARALVLRAIAQEALELARDRVARRQVAERDLGVVELLLEALDERPHLGLGRDRFVEAPLVLDARLLEPAELERHSEERLDPPDQLSNSLRLYLRSEAVEDAALAELIADALHRLPDEPDDPEIAALSEFVFQRLFAVLETNAASLGQDTVAQLEWTFLPTLGHEPHVPTLSREMAASPAFFVEVFTTVFPPEESETHELSEEERSTQYAAVQNGLTLLSSWSEPPGGGNADQLKSWVDEASTLLADVGRLDIGRHYIGQALTCTVPANESGEWPRHAPSENYSSRFEARTSKTASSSRC